VGPRDRSHVNLMKASVLSLLERCPASEAANGNTADTRKHPACCRRLSRTRFVGRHRDGSWGLRHDGWMGVELLVIPECPGAEEASVLLRAALNDIGLPDSTFTVRLIDTDEAARARRLPGSPAFVVDGMDLFDNGDGHESMACRMYVTPDGPRNLPRPGGPLRCPQATSRTYRSSRQPVCGPRRGASPRRAAAPVVGRPRRPSWARGGRVPSAFVASGTRLGELIEVDTGRGRGDLGVVPSTQAHGRRA
jgi:hypothetical protein